MALTSARRTCRDMTRMQATTMDAAMISFPPQGPEFCIQALGFFAQTGNRGLFRFKKNHEKAPQKKCHQPAHRKHVVGKFKKMKSLADDILNKAHGHGTAGRPQQGDDAAGPGDIGHPDKKPLAEFGGFIPLPVEGIDGHQQRDKSSPPPPCAP